MRLPHRLLNRVARHTLAVVAVLAQFVAAVGMPVVSARSAKDRSAPFPCQDHPCGCATPEQGWAGDCCCFTLEQKLAWADAHGVTPPDHVRPAVEARKAAQQPKPKPKKSCCADEPPASCCDSDAPPCEKHAAPAAPTVRWVAGIFAQKCRGAGDTGWLKADAGIAPMLPSVPVAPAPLVETFATSDCRAIPISLPPAIPPPRAS